MFHYYHQRRHQNILFVVGAAENDTERLAEPRYQLEHFITTGVWSQAWRRRPEEPSRIRPSIDRADGRGTGKLGQTFGEVLDVAFSWVVPNQPAIFWSNVLHLNLFDPCNWSTFEG